MSTFAQLSSFRTPELSESEGQWPIEVGQPVCYEVWGFGEKRARRSGRRVDLRGQEGGSGRTEVAVACA